MPFVTFPLASHYSDCRYGSESIDGRVRRDFKENAKYPTANALINTVRDY